LASSIEASDPPSRPTRGRVLLFGILSLALAAPALAQAPGAHFKDCAECPSMLALPGGRFVMGAGEDEARDEGMPDDVARRELPRREVRVPAFAVAKFETTVGEYRAFAVATGRAPGDGCWAWEGKAEWVKEPALSWRAPGFEQDDAHPVVCVSWEDATAYVAWLSRKTGRRYRLPSEAEWEYAARAGSSATRPWGLGTGGICLQENVSDFGHRLKYRLRTGPELGFVCADGHAETAPVGTFRANAFGLHDLLGNVFEWVEDCWNETHDGAPSDAAARRVGDCATRVRKGGAWGADPGLARPAYRDRNTLQGRANMLGFRVARDLD
jgi:formylglycine-generating enzyme required for sulfatase activity